MKQRIVIFLLGLVIGGSLVFLAIRSRSSTGHRGELPTAGIQSESALAEQLDQASARVADLIAEREELHLQLRALKTKSGSLPALNSDQGGSASGTSADTNGTTMSVWAAKKEELRTWFSESIEIRVERLRDRLRLTPDQVGQVRSALERPFNDHLDSSDKVVRGEASLSQLKQQTEETGNPEEAILILLSPEQQAAYHELHQEERRGTAAMLANGELNLMQMSLGLSDEQREQARVVLSAEAEHRLNKSNAGVKRPDLEWLRESMERKAETLSGVLTPDQLRQYRKIQDQQLRLLELRRPKDASDRTQAP